MLLVGIPFRFLFTLVIQAACSPFKTWHAQHMAWYDKVRQSIAMKWLWNHKQKFCCMLNWWWNDKCLYSDLFWFFFYFFLQMAFCKNIEIVNNHQKSNTLLTYKISNSQETRKKEWKISFTSIKLRQMLFLLVEEIKKKPP